jgi:hydroxymethylglutaryl-CoA reductase
MNGKSIYVPMATTEGAILASCNRGLKAIYESGGVTSMVVKRSLARESYFECESLKDAITLQTMIEQKKDELKIMCEGQSTFAQCTSIHTRLRGSVVLVKFEYWTGDAAGQNMVTFSSFPAYQWIVQHSPVTLRFHAISCTSDGDKNYSPSIECRGMSVCAEVVIRKEICENVLKVQSDQFVRMSKCGNIGSETRGSIYHNANFSNMVAAIFAATGQDLACIAECAAGSIRIEVLTSGDVHCEVYMPSLLVGSVGGGTGLPEQKECVNMILSSDETLKAGKKSEYLACVIACCCLALDLSTTSSVIAGSFVSAHKRLGR